MKKYLNYSFVVFTSLIILTGCSSPEEKLKKEVATLEKSLYNDSTMVPDVATAKKMIDLYLSFAEKFPADTNSAGFLFKAGDIASKVNETHMAVEIFERMVKNYPENHNTPYALFLQGFILENQAGDPMKAKPYYEKFLATYPDHPIAPDVMFSIENLGKTPEQLILEFEKNNNDSTLADSSSVASM